MSCPTGSRLGPATGATFVFGAVHAGDAPNAIPAEAQLRGAIRTQSPALWSELCELELGASALAEAPQSWGGDDFGWYTHQVPGAYLRLGTHDPSHGADMLDLHAGRFDVDEDAIGIGVRVLVAIAEDWLSDVAPG